MTERPRKIGERRTYQTRPGDPMPTIYPGEQCIGQINLAVALKYATEARDTDGRAICHAPITEYLVEPAPGLRGLAARVMYRAAWQWLAHVPLRPLQRWLRPQLKLEIERHDDRPHARPP